ncbi:hypothetical protein S245_061243, partial [Arachis hypogaea]
AWVWLWLRVALARLAKAGAGEKEMHGCGCGRDGSFMLYWNGDNRQQRQVFVGSEIDNGECWAYIEDWEVMNLKKMEEKFDLVTDVNPKKLQSHFKVYVVRIWEVPSKYNEKEIASIEIILQDAKMYTMTNFIVFDHKYKEKNGVSRMVLTFSQRTLVNHVKKPIFPLEAFYLKSYVDLLTADKLPDSEMFNLIRKVVGKEDPRDLITSKGKETKRLVIILQDL